MKLRAILTSAAAVLIAIVLAWASTRLPLSWDWTMAGRHTLSPASRELLRKFDGPVTITAFVAADPKLQRAISELVGRYQRVKHDIELAFVDPKREPERARALGIAAGGELVLRYRDRRTKLRVADEAHLSAALLQLASTREPWVVFVSGHGERDPHGEANHDLGRFTESLSQRGMHVQTLDLSRTPVIPDNTSLLVLSSPQTEWQPRELDSVMAYLARGGDLLWLGDPGDQPGLARLAQTLGVRWLNGIVLSARSAALGVSNPSFLVSGLASDSPLGAAGIDTVLLPVAAAMSTDPASRWKTTPLLRSDAQSWTETGSLEDQPLRFNPETGEQRGPLALGFTLTRAFGPREQRIAVTGDGDFLSNAFLANGANLDLGVALVHWLDHDDLLVGVTTARAADLRLNLSDRQLALVAWGFPFLLPALLAGAGIGIQIARRRH